MVACENLDCASLYSGQGFLSKQGWQLADNPQVARELDVFAKGRALAGVALA
jgi:hypothetical protein